MLELFGVAVFEDLGKHMRNPAFDGFTQSVSTKATPSSRMR